MTKSNILKMVNRASRPLFAGALVAACTLGLSVSAPSSASAAAFLYELHDHPDGTLASPDYGLRLDGLYGGTSNDFTFSFDTNGAYMTLLYDQTANTVRISGTAYGGIDTGSGWDANNSGLVNIDFTYRQNVVTDGTGTFGTDTDNLGVRTTGHAQTVGTGNSGSLTLGAGNWSLGANTGDSFTMVDQESGGFSFKFNNFDDHRLAQYPSFGGPEDYVGWGWLNHWPTGSNPAGHIYYSDWLFTGLYLPPPTTTETPEPGMIALFGLGVAGLAWRRRRRTA